MPKKLDREAKDRVVHLIEHSTLAENLLMHAAY